MGHNDINNKSLLNDDSYLLENPAASTDLDPKAAFEQKVLRKIQSEYGRSTTYLSSYHQKCKEYHAMYHNSQEFDSYQGNSLFPVSFFQEQIDLAASELLDKLYYKNQPCTVVPRPGVSRGDADQKQALLKYQDDEDGMYLTMKKSAKDAVMYRMAAAQTDYTEEFETEYSDVDIPDGYMMEPQMTAVGLVRKIVQKFKTIVKPSRVAVYKGPASRRVDPTDIFFTQDKLSMDDDESIMVRSWMSNKDFKKKAYFFNIEKIKPITLSTSDSGTHQEDIARAKKQFLNTSMQTADYKKKNEYIESQCLLNKKELFEYLNKPVDDIDPEEEIWAMAGMANGSTLVRLHNSPYDKPNIEMGFIIDEENEMYGGSISDRIIASQRGMEKTFGMILENLKQSINAGYVINVNALQDQSEIEVNKESFIIKTKASVHDTVQRIEQPRVSKDLYNLLDIFKFYGQAASGFNDLKSGRGDSATDTLGEANIVQQQSNIRVTDYLKMFEVTFVVPLYKFRNFINVVFLGRNNENYLYRILRDGVHQWESAPPSVVRASVSFVCESASRETNRAVITSQLLQLAQIAPLAIQAGQPFRIDKLIYELCTTGFSYSQDKTEELLPLIRYERENGSEAVDELLVQNATLQQAMIRQQYLMTLGAQAAGVDLGLNNSSNGEGGSAAASPGEQIPQPTSEGDAIVSASQRNQPTSA